MKNTHSTLPNGVKADLPLAQFRRVWQIWLALAPIAAARGEGVEVYYPTGHQWAMEKQKRADELIADRKIPGIAFGAQLAVYREIESGEMAHPTVEIMTVYAPQWEGVRVVCMPDGSAVWCSEQSAPDLIGVDFTAPPPPAPWEKEGFEDRCKRRRLATLRARLVTLISKRGEKYEAADQALTALGVLVLWETTGVFPTDEQVRELERLWPVE